MATFPTVYHSKVDLTPMIRRVLSAVIESSWFKTALVRSLIHDRQAYSIIHTDLSFVDS